MIKEFSGEYRWLSNFAPCVIDMDGDYYSSVEHAYQASKTFEYKERKEFCINPYSHIFPMTAGQAKRAGQKVTKRSDWDNVKLFVMDKLNRQKYTNFMYKDFLLATKDQEIIEGNTWGDTFWGVCDGVGENHLGKIIMKIREELKELNQ